MGTHKGKGKAKEREHARPSRLQAVKKHALFLPPPINSFGKKGKERVRRREKRSKVNQKNPQPQRNGKISTTEVTENIREARLSHENLRNIFLAFLILIKY